jgi:hypothetical protein
VREDRILVNPAVAVVAADINEVAAAQDGLRVFKDLSRLDPVFQTAAGGRISSPYFAPMAIGR